MQPSRRRRPFEAGGRSGGDCRRAGAYRHLGRAAGYHGVYGPRAGSRTMPLRCARAAWRCRTGRSSVMPACAMRGWRRWRPTPSTTLRSGRYQRAVRPAGGPRAGAGRRVGPGHWSGRVRCCFSACATIRPARPTWRRWLRPKAAMRLPRRSGSARRARLAAAGLAAQWRSCARPRALLRLPLAEQRWPWAFRRHRRGDCSSRSTDGCREFRHWRPGRHRLGHSWKSCNGRRAILSAQFHAGFNRFWRKGVLPAPFGRFQGM